MLSSCGEKLIFVSIHFSDATFPSSAVNCTTATMLNTYYVSPFYVLQIVVVITTGTCNCIDAEQYSSTYGLCHAVSLPPKRDLTSVMCPIDASCWHVGQKIYGRIRGYFVSFYCISSLQRLPLNSLIMALFPCLILL